MKQFIYHSTMALLSWTASVGAAYLVTVCSLSIAIDVLSLGMLVANAVIGTVALVASTVAAISAALHAVAAEKALKSRYSPE